MRSPRGEKQGEYLGPFHNAKESSTPSSLAENDRITYSTVTFPEEPHLISNVSLSSPARDMDANLLDRVALHPRFFEAQEGLASQLQILHGRFRLRIDMLTLFMVMVLGQSQGVEDQNPGVDLE